MMPIVDLIISSQRLEGAIAVLAVWIALKLIDRIIWRLFNEKLFTKAYKKAKRKGKAIWTRKEHIKADFEFSVDIRPDITVREAKAQVEDLHQAIRYISNGEFNVVETWEKSDTEVRSKICPSGKSDTYTVDFQFVPDPTSENVLDAPVTSAGIKIEFDFAFAHLKGAIIDLTSFSSFLQKALEQTYPTIRISDTRFVVAPINSNNLTLDDWIQKQQFDVSLLLRSPDNERRSVRFSADRAEITSPHENVDDETVEHIRATLLNYYL